MFHFLTCTTRIVIMDQSAGVCHGLGGCIYVFLQLLYFSCVCQPLALALVGIKGRTACCCCC